jgi:hypothetical protein
LSSQAYRIGRKIYSDGNTAMIDLDDACRCAEQHGWVLKSNIIIGFDIKKLTMNRHLLEGTELGLL